MRDHIGLDGFLKVEVGKVFEELGKDRYVEVVFFVVELVLEHKSRDVGHRLKDVGHRLMVFGEQVGVMLDE